MIDQLKGVEQEALHGDMIDVLRMLLASCNKDDDSDLNGDGRRLLLWLETAVREFSLGKSYKFTRTANKVLITITDCFLSHRWTIALRVFMTLLSLREASHSRSMLLAFFEICLQLDLDPNSLILHFRCFYALTDSFLSYNHFLFSVAANWDLSSIQKALTPSWPAKQSNHIFSERPFIRFCKMMRGFYCGLLAYIDYTNLRLTLPTADDSDLVAQKMSACADVAKAQWEQLPGEPGVWDVFVVKYVDILERENDLKNCEEVLQTYRRSSAVPTNALQMLYSFYSRHGWTDTQQKVDLLQELCSLDESSNRVLELYQLLAKSEDPERISLLFTYLDYATTRDNRHAWKCLSREVLRNSSGLASKSEVKIVSECWSEREDWWPTFHFSEHSLPDVVPLSGEEMDLIALKAQVAQCFLGTENSYTLSVKALLSNCQSSRKTILRLFRPLPTCS